MTEYIGGKISKMIQYNCPKDCNFQLETGGSWDNPQIGGCSIDDIFASGTDFEEDDNLITCPFYMRPLPKLEDEDRN